MFWASLLEAAQDHYKKVSSVDKKVSSAEEKLEVILQKVIKEWGQNLDLKSLFISPQDHTYTLYLYFYMHAFLFIYPAV